ncbi:hypothetical protein LJR066_006672 [Acidovorax sp. LjRoot66]|uniref:hypothetical protein n=1 Tax=Acidovorax sp. LjRoot66 TaxID=3342334 RepID=UPI003ECE3A8F
MTQHSKSIRPVDHENGSVFTFSRMFGTHGPHLIDGKRLDQLTGVDLLLDSSTSVVSQTSYATTTSNATGVLGRAVVGGLVAGGVGALVGGTTGAKTTTSAGSSVESINTQLTVKLTFEAGQTIHAVVTDLAAYHWLLSFPGKPPATSEELEIAKAQSVVTGAAKVLDERAERYLPNATFQGSSAMLPIGVTGLVLVAIYMLAFPSGIFWFVAFLIIAFISCVLVSAMIESGDEKRRAAFNADRARHKEHIIAELTRGRSPGAPGYAEFTPDRP